MRASMHAHAVRREESPRASTEAIRVSEGGLDGSCVVARRTARCTEETRRLMVRVALRIEALSFRMPMNLNRAIANEGRMRKVEEDGGGSAEEDIN